MKKVAFVLEKDDPRLPIHENSMDRYNQKKIKTLTTKNLFSKTSTKKSDYKNLDNSKYLDLDVWVFENLNRTFKLNLHNKTGLKILDISTGFGYFPYICNHFGHSAEGTDLKYSKNNLYKKVTTKLKIY